MSVKEVLKYVIIISKLKIGAKMSVSTIVDYTYEDYRNWEGDWELIEGVPISMAPAPSRVHQNIATEILVTLKNSIEDEECPDCVVSFENDWKISNDTILRPDIIFTCDDEGTEYLTKAPKIIIEILSPSTARKDETIKFDIYEEEGVEYYILVYPDDLRAKVYRLIDGKYRKIGDFTKESLEFEGVDCGLSIDFAKVFAPFRK
jgi:Uma2 family endonuclease